MEKILVTGAAGFIGFHLSFKLIKEGYEVHGIDNINSYYDTSLKDRRLANLKKYKNFKFHLLDIADFESMNDFFSKNKFSFLIHLAAQAGVRYSYENPQAYIDSNIKGFANILESCRKHNIKKIFYASSSSVYGNSTDEYFNEKETKLNPISLYGFTKKMNEELALNYHNLFNINSIGLRFFSVYGPWGRPDMAYYKFTKKILNNENINVFNKGQHARSFTYIDDVIESIYKLYRIYNQEEKFNDIYNIAGGESVTLNDFIVKIEKICNKVAIKSYISKQNGDVNVTSADCNKIFQKINYSPHTNIDIGLLEFYKWYSDFLND